MRLTRHASARCGNRGHGLAQAAASSTHGMRQQDVAAGAAAWPKQRQRGRLGQGMGAGDKWGRWG